MFFFQLSHYCVQAFLKCSKNILAKIETGELDPERIGSGTSGLVMRCYETNNNSHLLQAFSTEKAYCGRQTRCQPPEGLQTATESVNSRSGLAVPAAATISF